MNPKQINDGHILIAEFLGWFEDGEKGTWYKKTDCSIIIAYSIHSNYPHNDLPFLRSYEHLMLIIDKIEKLGYWVQIDSIGISISEWKNKGMDSISYHLTCTQADNDKKLAIWLTVVKFIEWHNKNK